MPDTLPFSNRILSMNSKVGEHREVVKHIGWKISELIDSLKLLNDALLKIRAGEDHYLAALTGQLRAIVTDKKKGSKPLLLDVASYMDQKLPVFGLAGVNPLPPPESLEFYVQYPSFSINRVSTEQVEYSLAQALGINYIFYRGRKYSINDVVAFFANRAGGAHYSHTIPQPFADMLSMRLMDRVPIVDIVVAFGEVITRLGAKLLNNLTSAEHHYIIYLDEYRDHVTSIFDYIYPDNPMRISMQINGEGIINCRIVDIRGFSYDVSSDRLIDFSDPRHIRFSYFINEDLTTTLIIDVDGDRVCHALFPVPVMVANSLEDYRRLFAKIDGNDTNTNAVGVSTMITFRGSLSPWDASNLIMYMEKQRVSPDTKVALYEAGSYSEAASLTDKHVMVGPVRIVDAKDALPLWGANASKHEPRPMGW